MSARVGYAGQRYEVRYIQAGTGVEKVIGWTTEADGGALMRMTARWPEVADGPEGKRAWVVDLHPET